MSNQKRNVVVTGLGVISSLGFDKDTFFDNLCKGRDATKPIASTDTTNYRRVNAVEITEQLPQEDNWNGYSRASKMALSAVKDALSDAEIEVGSLTNRAGISLGAMIGGSLEIEKQYCGMGGRDIGINEKDMLMQYTLNSVADTIAYEFDIRGMRNTVITACASGTTAIGIAYKWIVNGRADIVICGGVDPFRPLTHLGLSAFRIITSDKVRPFDIKRKGILVGEGAGILILESEDRARKRGAKAYCRVLGYGASCDANDLAHPEEDGLGMSLAMERAIHDGGINKKLVGYINAHGTGTEKNDSAEVSAIKKVFGQHSEKICISSIKGAIGHTIGAAGGIEAVATVLSLKHQKVPPTINVQEQDPYCNIDIVPNKSKECSDLQIALSNSFGFGGNNASVLFGRCDNV